METGTDHEPTRLALLSESELGVLIGRCSTGAQTRQEKELAAKLKAAPNLEEAADWLYSAGYGSADGHPPWTRARVRAGLAALLEFVKPLKRTS